MNTSTYGWITIDTPYGSVDIDPDRWTRDEKAMLAAGRCPWLTAYGVPGTRVCGKPGRPLCRTHDADEREASAGRPLAYANVVDVRRVLNHGASDGYLALMDQVRLSDWDDPWGTAMVWLYAVCGVMYLRFDEVLPEFRPSPGLSVVSIEDEYPGRFVLDLVDDGTVTEDDLRAVYMVMERYRAWAVLAGRDY